MTISKKTLSFLALLVAFAGIHSSRAEEKRETFNWECGADDIESLTVSARADGKYSAQVAWDCFPGDGICDAKAIAALSSAERENTVFEGPRYKLVIYTSQAAARDGSFDGHISAVAQGPKDEGGGMTIDEDVSCKRTCGK